MVVSYFSHPLLKKNKIEKRLYQETILASSVNRNTLVVLPTGLGKTLIAALVAVYRLDKFKGSRCIFLAPTKPLVVQHYNTFKEVLNIPEEKLIVLTGEVPPAQREKLWGRGVVYFTTPQVLENDLIFKRLSLEDVSLIIFDEAHRAVGDYPYPHIAKVFISQSKHPLILGLTASPGASEEKVEEICRNLYISNIEIRNELSEDVKPYVVPTTVKWVRLNLPEGIKKVKALLEGILKNHKRFLFDHNIVDPQSSRYLSKRLLLELQGKLRRVIDREGGSTLLLTATSIVAEAFRLVHMLELLETQGLSTLRKYFNKLDKESHRPGSARAIKNLLSNPDFLKARALVDKLYDEGEDHPKLEYTSNIVRSQLSGDPNSRIIVFTQYRESALRLVSVLSRIPEARVKRFVGQATRGGDKGLPQKEQLRVLEEFRDGKVNVIVATSVAEEGLDISECNLVVFYDFAPSVIRFIQRRGRTGRRNPGNVVILITKGTRDENYYWSVTRREYKMKKLMGSLSLQGKLKNVTSEQNRLDRFIGVEGFSPDKIKVIVDNRETSSAVVRELSNLGVEVVPAQLPVGDYAVSDYVVVERKTTSDFIQSLIDKRLFNQIINLKRNYSTVVFIIEGVNLYSIRNVHPNAIRGALSSIILDYNIPLLWSIDPSDTAKLIYALARREQVEKKHCVSLKRAKLKLTVKEAQEQLLAGLPQVNSALSRRLLKAFGSPINVFNASEEELKRVEGIGEIKAKHIREVLDTKYEE